MPRTMRDATHLLIRARMGSISLTSYDPPQTPMTAPKRLRYAKPAGLRPGRVGNLCSVACVTP